MSDSDEFNKAKGSKPRTSAQLVVGVTGFNYVEKAREFIKRNGGTGAMICQRSTMTKGDSKPIEADLGKWGAWIVYFKRIGRPRGTRKHIEHQDYQMVPAEWPHMFDANATIAADYAAADDFTGGRITETLLTPRDREPPYRPYPRLWEAFANNTGILHHRDFGTLTEASRILAMRGKADAEAYLNGRPTDGWLPKRQQPAAPVTPPPPPPKSSADLKTPAAPASDELRAMVGLPPRPIEPPPMPGDDEFIEGFDIP